MAVSVVEKISRFALNQWGKKGHSVLNINSAKKNIIELELEKGMDVTVVSKNKKELDNIKQKVKKTHVEGYGKINLPSNSYDLVISNLSLMNKTEVGGILKEMKRLSKRKGFIILAEENQPKNVVKKIVYTFLRVPGYLVLKILYGIPPHFTLDVTQEAKKESLKILYKKEYLWGAFGLAVCRQV